MRFDDMKDDEILRRYLLGDLDAEQADELERRLLGDEDLFDLAEAVEADLLDAVARGELSAAERGRIRRRLTKNPGGRARLALVSGLIAASRQELPIPAEVRAFRLLARPGVRAAAIAASLSIAACGLWLGTQTLEPGRGVVCIGCTESTVVLQLALTTVRSFGAVSPPPLVIPAGTGDVEIRLPLGPDDPSVPFAVILRDAESGQEIRSMQRLAPQPVDGGRALVLTVPADRMKPGIYEVEVRVPTAEGDELFGKPMFEVASK